MSVYQLRSLDSHCLWISGKYSQAVIHLPINQRPPCGLVSHFIDCLAGFLWDKHPPGMWMSMPQVFDSAAHTGCGHLVTFEQPWSTWDICIPWNISFPVLNSQKIGCTSYLRCFPCCTDVSQPGKLHHCLQVAGREGKKLWWGFWDEVSASSQWESLTLC